MRTLAVVGSRGYPSDSLAYFLPQDVKGFDRVVSGGARGADGAGEAFASTRGLSVVSYRPVKFHTGYVVHRLVDGKDTGPVAQSGVPKVYPGFAEAAKARNWWIARDCERMCAFWDGISGGTAHAISCAVRLRRELVLHMPGDS